MIVHVTIRIIEPFKRRAKSLSGVLDTDKLPDRDWRIDRLRPLLSRAGCSVIRVKAFDIEAEHWRCIGPMLAVAKVPLPATIEGSHVVRVLVWPTEAGQKNRF